MVTGVIPARYGSTRFPAKALAPLRGFPLVQHVHAGARKARLLDRVCIATDDRRIADVVSAFGGTALMTRADHPSGTDRILEAACALGLGDDDLVINIQGDEPLIRPEYIDRAAAALRDTREAEWVTLVYPLASREKAASTTVVKAVLDSRGFALYFSRLPIPYDRDGARARPLLGHIGLYGYRVAALKRFAKLPQGILEQTEKLEQLRALEHGMRIYCVQVGEPTPGVDTPEDLAHVERILAEHPELCNMS